MAKNLAHYLALSYVTEVVREDGVFVASHPDLPGCVAQGDTADEAIGSLDDARAGWIEVRLASGLFVPEPLPEEYSGRISVRLPSWLHASLAAKARRDDISLNFHIVTILARDADGDKAAVAENLAESRALVVSLQTLVEKEGGLARKGAKRQGLNQVASSRS